jgi:hypothetical protein
VVVVTCFVLCGCVYVWVFVMRRCVCVGFGNMCTCIYWVVSGLYCVFLYVSFMYFYSYLFYLY